LSFLSILVLDFFMGLFFNRLHDQLFGPVVPRGS
jgi:hypothetical protein